MMKLFICYAHADQDDLKPLVEVLAPLKAEGLIDAWSDHRIGVGEKWQDAISDALETCDVGLFLITRSFRASEFIRSVEKKRLLARYDEGTIKIVPIQLWSCDVTGSGFEAVQPLPGWNQWVYGSSDRAAISDHWRTVSQELRAIATDFSRARAPEITYDRIPFPGLLSFDPDQAAVFRGRDDEIRELSARLSGDQHMLILFGESGSGKSSLAKAGVAATLVPPTGGDADPLVITTPNATGSGDPFLGLAGELRRFFARAAHPTQRELATELASDLSQVTARIDQVLRGRPAGAEFVFVFDQFEETFIDRAVAEEHRAPYIRLVDHLANHPRVRVILTVRSDFYPNLTAHPEMNRRHNSPGCPYNVQPLGLDRVRDIIEDPARAAGFTFDPGLVDRLVKDAGAEGNKAVPLLAFCLAELVKPLRKGTDGDLGAVPLSERVLRASAYEAMGGMNGAIGRAAEAARQGASDEVLARLARKLVTETADGRPARLAASWQEIASDVEARALAERLIDARLLVKSKDSVEIAHEALVGAWAALESWIERHKDDLHQRARVEVEARQWADHGRDPKLLWPHERLAPLDKALTRLGVTYDKEEHIKEFIRPEATRLIERLKDRATSHDEREDIGRRLDKIGDRRPGVGVINGVPDILWCKVPSGSVELESGLGHRNVAAFKIAAYPITNGQFQAFLKAADYSSREWWRGLATGPLIDGAVRRYRNHAAIEVSWFDAKAFCRWLSDKRGEPVRLPIEAEWQWAAQSGNATFVYPWGAGWSDLVANTSEAEIRRAIAVGMYPDGQSYHGTYDMAGNVWEWCADEYARDDVGTEQDSEFVSCVARGGSWFNDRDDARATYRYSLLPFERDDHLGFRVCTGPSV